MKKGSQKQGIEKQKGGSGPGLNYHSAYNMAREKLAAGNVKDMALFSRCAFDEKGSRFEVPYFGDSLLVDFPGGEVYRAGGGEVSLTTAILVLHYLTGASGLPPKGKLISFKELPGGEIYLEPFSHRVVNRLVRFFGRNPGRFLAAGKKLGGTKREYGDASVTLWAFPLVPITFVLWEGDEEFGPSATVLYDQTAPEHLATEDLVVLAGDAVARLRTAAPGEEDR